MARWGGCASPGVEPGEDTPVDTPMDGAETPLPAPLGGQVGAPLQPEAVPQVDAAAAGAPAGKQWVGASSTEPPLLAAFKKGAKKKIGKQGKKGAGAEEEGDSS